MSWRVDYWSIPKIHGGSHAQMREQPKFVKPDPKDIHKRYFDDYKSATSFAQSMFDSGNYYSQVIKDS